MIFKEENYMLGVFRPEKKNKHDFMNALYFQINSKTPTDD